MHDVPLPFTTSSQVQLHANTLQLSHLEGSHFASITRPGAFSNCHSLSYTCTGNGDQELGAIDQALTHALYHLPKLNTACLQILPGTK
jgi:hypothetical protein